MKNVMKKIMLFAVTLLFCISGMACSKNNENKELPEPAENNNNVIIGFSQLGAESDWRSENTQSMKETFTEENGYELIFDDGQQKQANQITAIRKFIQQEVDYIVLAPVTETGWDTVLQEAKDAGIPVIIVDRMVDVKNSSLFSAWVGSNFELEAQKMTAWINEFVTGMDIAPEDIHIVNIQGNIGASAQIGRTKGLEDACEKYGWDLVAEMSGEFTQAKGREVMEMFLSKYDNINIVYCENDNEALGAIEALEAAGCTVGSNIADGEIMVVSFDGVGKAAVEMARAGKISCIAECNPLHGPRVRAIVEKLEIGSEPDKLEYVEERIYSANPAVKTIIVDGKVYQVDIIE